MSIAQKITPCLWFDDQADQADQAAKFYTSVFKNSRILKTARYGEAGYEVHGKKAGTVLTVEFELNGQALLSAPDYEKTQRVMQAMLQMKKLDIEMLQRAFDGR